MQVKFIIDLVATLANATAVTRWCRKLKPFWDPLYKGKRPSKQGIVPQVLSGRRASVGALQAGAMIALWEVRLCFEARALLVALCPVLQGLLKQSVDINLTADRYVVHHDAQDSEDPSDMVYLTMSR